MDTQRIAILTYAAPHRKTEDMLWRLVSRGLVNVSVIATPWEYRKPRPYLYAHRPAEPPWPCEPIGDTAAMCHSLTLPYTVVAKEELHRTLDSYKPTVVLVAGAGIIAPEIVNHWPVLNVHPGLLPQCRGLDILKWSIIEGLQVGVTAHICDERPDLGWRISEKVVPIYHQDSFQSFAMRQYEMELSLIVPALMTMYMKGRGEFQRIEDNGTESRRRMPRKTEAGLPEAFERYKRIHATA